MAGGASYPAPKLVELAQAEPVGVFDDQGVGVGDVQTGFNDGGAHQHLNVPFRHGLHHVAQGVFSHLSVGHAHPQTGNPPLEGTGTLVDGLRAVVQVVHLPAPLHLPADGVVNHRVVVLHDEGLHRVAVGGGLLDGGHIPDTGQGHVQRPGDGRCGQCQHVHTLGHFF